MLAARPINENDSISQRDEKNPLPPKLSTCAAVIRKLRKGKTIIHLSDDITIATLHAADITDPLWDSLADMAVGAVLLTVSLIELEETNEELEELNEELKEINNKILEAKHEVKTRQALLEEQKKHHENQIKWTEFNKNLCKGAIALSATYSIDMGLNTGANVAARFGHELVLNQLGNAGIVIGVTTVPVVIMFLILMKQCIDLGIFYDQRNEQIKIYNGESSSEEEKAAAKAKIEEIDHKIFYKKGEIFAQTFIAVSFFLSLLVVSGVATFGVAPLALMIAGAAIGTFLKLHEIYTNTQREIEEQNKTIQKQKEALQNTTLGKQILHEALKDTNDTVRKSTATIETQQQTIKQLQQELAAKNIKIAELEHKEHKSNLHKFSKFKKSPSLPSLPTSLSNPCMTS